MLPLPHVLLVDDDPTTNFLNKLMLMRMSVAQQVLVAENGEQALRALDQYCQAPADPACPQLILLDMNMPVLNGLGFLEAYVQLPLARQQHTIIVMLTTSLHPTDLARVRQLPIAGFINKPLTRQKVTDLWRQYFAQ